MENVLKEFESLGQKASFHFADDSGAEWYLGDKAEKDALELFDEHPDLQNQMREIARGFLWSLRLVRPE